LEYLSRKLRLSVKDDGVGIIPGKTESQPAGSRSFGLVGMQERVELLGGIFEVVSNPEKGTEIIVIVHV
jgi:signal transduction histidine kinase